jgi:hypothetical protein
MRCWVEMMHNSIYKNEQVVLSIQLRNSAVKNIKYIEIFLESSGDMWSCEDNVVLFCGNLCPDCHCYFVAWRDAGVQLKKKHLDNNPVAFAVTSFLISAYVDFF